MLLTAPEASIVISLDCVPETALDVEVLAAVLASLSACSYCFISSGNTDPKFCVSASSKLYRKRYHEFPPTELVTSEKSCCAVDCIGGAGNS